MVSNLGYFCMNPRLVKFAVELQNSEKVEKKDNSLEFKSENKFFNLLKPAKVVVVVNPIE